MELYVILVIIAVLFFMVSGIPLCIKFLYIAHIRAQRRRQGTFGGLPVSTPKHVPYNDKQDNIIYSQLHADPYNQQEQEYPTYKIKTQNYYNQAQSDSVENSSYNSYNATPQKQGGYHLSIDQPNSAKTPQHSKQLLQQQSSLEVYIQKLQQEEKENKKFYQQQKQNNSADKSPYVSKGTRQSYQQLPQGNQSLAKQQQQFNNNTSFKSPPNQGYNNSNQRQPQEWQFMDSGEYSSVEQVYKQGYKQQSKSGKNRDQTRDTGQKQQKQIRMHNNEQQNSGQGYKIKYEVV